MILGNNYKAMFECDYLDANLQNANDMNLNCIKNKNKGNEQLCMSEYKLYDNIAINSQFIAIKRDMDAGFGINKYDSEKKNNSNISQLSNNTIEGFQNYNNTFIVPTGLGETNIENKCSEGYTYENNKCKQVCTNCKYNDQMRSQQFNEYDKCFPQGVYDGINENGFTKCNCGNNNQYCSTDYIHNFYPAEGYFKEIKNFNINTLF